MVRSSPLHHASCGEQRVLLVGAIDTAQDLRATILRSRGVQVDTAGDLQEARFRWRPGFYDWILLDVRKYLPGETLDFCEQIKETAPGQQIAFLIGPPLYLSLDWPEEVLARKDQPHQWEETVQLLSRAGHHS